MNAQRKLETAIRDNYLRHPEHTTDALAEMQMLVSGDEHLQKLPRIHIQATAAQTEGFANTDPAEKEASVTIAFIYSPDDYEKARADDILAEIECLLENRAAFLGAMNKPETEPDERPVQDIYLYAANLETGDEAEVDERSMMVGLVYRFIYRTDNGDGT